VRETTAVELAVEGEIPRDLFGAYVRNGPNAVFEPTNPYHWFDGDGMLHAVHFRDGRASYRCRQVRTRGLADEVRRGRAIWPGVTGPIAKVALPTRVPHGFHAKWIAGERAFAGASEATT
jgi:carotenoid cleavage dioxygenase